MNNLSVFVSICLLMFGGFASSVHAEDCPRAFERLKSVSRGSVSDIDSVKNELKEIESLCPALVDIQYEYGRLHLNSGSFDDALEYFRKADSSRPRLEYLLGVAKSLAYLERYVDAENSFKDAIAKYSAHWKALEGLGVLYLILGRFRESEELFNQALQEESNADSLYYNLGVALERQGRIDEALVSYRTALNRNPRNKEARVAIIKRYFEAGKFGEASSFIEEGILFFSSDRELLLLHVEQLEKTGEFDDAQNVLDRIMSEKDDPVIASRRAILMIKNGNNTEGLENLEALFKANEDDLDVIRSYGWALIKLKKFSQAEQITRAALSRFPEDPVILNNLGVILEEAGRTDEAREAFRRAALYSPHSEVIQSNHMRVQ